MKKENKTSYENLLNIKRKLASDIDEKMRGVDLKDVDLRAEASFRSYGDGDYSVSARVVIYLDGSNNSVDVTCYNYDDYETNKSKAAFFLNQMEAFFAYVKRLFNSSNE